MSMFSPQRPKNPPPVQGGSKKPPTEIYCEIYPQASFSMKGVQYEDGALAIFIAKSMLSTRQGAPLDQALHMGSVLIFKKPEMHPPWEGDFVQRIPVDCMVAYFWPNHDENYSCWKVVDPTSGALLSCPGAWVFQCAAPGMKKL